MRDRTGFLLLALAAVFLVQLACDRADLLILRAQCEARGGTWTESVDTDGEIIFRCDLPPTPDTRPTATFAPRDCIITSTGYDWSYEDFRSTSGSGGVTCNARFVLQNRTGAPASLIIYTSWDNNAMRGNGWDTFLLQPGGAWETHVDRSVYTSGVVTYTRVERFLLVYDRPECAGMIRGESPEFEWELNAVEVTGIPCP